MRTINICLEIIFVAMSSFEQRIKASNRRGSSIGVQSNPLEKGVADESHELKVESLSEATLITDAQCEELINKLKLAE